MGIDVGSVRIGVAVSDPAARVALPVATVPRDRDDMARLAGFMMEYAVVEVIVGRPRHLSGADGAASTTAQRFAERLARRVAPVPVRLVDERLSTVAATRGLQQRGMSARQQRSVVDQEAAVFILQGWLDTAARAETGDGSRRD